MFKFILLLLMPLLVLAGAEPVYQWDFNPGSKPKLPLDDTVKTAPGWDGTPGAAGDQRIDVARFRQLMDWKEFTLELKLQPADKQPGVLASVARHSSGRGHFSVGINKFSQIEVRFLLRDDVSKKTVRDYSFKGKEVDWKPGQWYTLRVASASEGKLQIWLDGKLYAAVDDKGWGFTDLAGRSPEGFPVFTIGSSNRGSKNLLEAFTGVIDDVKLWDSVEVPAMVESAVKGISVKDPNIIFGEWSLPFTVPDRPGKLLDSFVKADEKFIKTAATVQLKPDDKNLVVTFNVPIPSGVTLKTDGKDAYSGDCVEFFVEHGTGYRHYAVNAGGKTAASHYIRSRQRSDDFQSNFTAAVKIFPEKYVVTMSIPLAEMDLDKSLARCNFTRNGPTSDGPTSWREVADFHQPGTFGKLLPLGRQKYLQEQLEKCRHNKYSAAVSREFEKLNQMVGQHGNDPQYWDVMNAALFNIEQSLISAELGQRSLLVWEGPVWDNDMSLTSNSKPLREINLTAAVGEKILVGLAISNLTTEPFMGQIKLINDEEEVKRFNRLLKPLALSKHLTFCEIMKLSHSNRDLYDPLLPLYLNSLLRIAPKTTMPLLVELKTAGLEPGIHRGLLYIKPALTGFEPEKIPFTVNVLDVDLDKIKLNNSVFEYATFYGRGDKNLASYYDEYDINTIYCGTPGMDGMDIYPKVDREGNIISTNFDDLDKFLSAFSSLKDKRLYFFLAWEARGFVHQGKIQLKTDTPVWKRGVVNFIRALADHVKKNYGIPPEHIIFYPNNEPHGDFDDPKSLMGKCHRWAELIQSAKAGVKVDSSIKIQNNPQGHRNLAAMSKVLNIIRLSQKRVTPEIAAMVKATGVELQCYGVLQNVNSPLMYRRASWLNIRFGASSNFSFWHIDGMAGGDGFCTYDSRDGKRTTDYGTLYVDIDNSRWLSSRRMEAWYQGFLDRKAYEYAKVLGKFSDAELKEIVDQAVDGDMETMNAMRQKLLSR